MDSRAVGLGFKPYFCSKKEANPDSGLAERNSLTSFSIVMGHFMRTDAAADVLAPVTVSTEHLETGGKIVPPEPYIKPRPTTVAA